MAQAPPGSDPGTVALINEGDDRTTFNEQAAAQAFVYQVKGRPSFAFGDIYLQQGQKIIADSNALLWMDGGINLGTNMRGGCCVACMRSCSGESCCLNDYEGTGANQKVSLGFKLPGDLMAFGTTHNNGWVFTYDAFVAGTDNLIVSSRFSGCCACCCADESMFLTTAKVKQGESGVVLAGGYGMIERHEVPAGETLLISRGLFFAAREDVSFNVGLIGQECGGCCNLLCADGGIIYKFEGPCVVYTQSKNPIQLLRDFGIPGGKETNSARAASLFCTVLTVSLKVAAAAGGAGGGGGGGGN